MTAFDPGTSLAAVSSAFSAAIVGLCLICATLFISLAGGRPTVNQMAAARRQPDNPPR